MIPEFKVFEKYSEDDLKMYMRMKIPMMDERDNVSHMKIHRLEGDKIFWKMNTIEHPDYPESKKIIRMYQNVTGY
jgi:hypothetical protein